MLKVKMVIIQFYPIIGGAERQAELLARALIARNVDVEVLTPRARNMPARLPDDPVPVRRLQVHGFRRLREASEALAVYRALVGYGKNVDVIHVHIAGHLAFAASLAARRLRVPMILKCSNSGPRFDLNMMEPIYGLAGRTIARHLARHTTRFVALNQEIGAQLAGWGVGAERIVYIPNGVEVGPGPTPELKKRLRNQLGLPEDEYLIIGIGSLHPKKDFSTLLRALARCRPETRASLILAGDGPQAADLKAEAAALHVESRVRFLGWVPPAAVGDYRAAADVFVLPSTTEGLSNALLEAMADMLPCVVSDVPGNRALVEPGETGLVFPVHDAGGLAGALEALARDPALRLALGQRARQRVVAGFSAEQIASQYVALYQSLRSVMTETNAAIDRPSSPVPARAPARRPKSYGPLGRLRQAIGIITSAVWQTFLLRVVFLGNKAGYFRHLGARVGSDCALQLNSLGSEPWLVELGNRVLIAQGVLFITHDGSTRLFRDSLPNSSRWGNRFGTIKVHDNCFLGPNTIIMPGIEIGPKSLVLAGSVVTHNVPPNTVVAGAPARHIGTYDEYVEKYKSRMIPIEATTREELRRELTMKLWGEVR